METVGLYGDYPLELYVSSEVAGGIYGEHEDNDDDNASCGR